MFNNVQNVYIQGKRISASTKILSMNYFSAKCWSSVGLVWDTDSPGVWMSLEFMKNPKQFGKRRGDRAKQYTCFFRKLTLKMW